MRRETHVEWDSGGFGRSREQPRCGRPDGTVLTGVCALDGCPQLTGKGRLRSVESEDGGCDTVMTMEMKLRRMSGLLFAATLTAGCADTDNGDNPFGSQTGTAPGLGTGDSAASNSDTEADGDEDGDGTAGDSTAGADDSGASSGLSETDAVICEVQDFTFTGTEEELQLQAGAQFIHVKAWGAGGNGDSNPCEADVGQGGVGGYSEAIFPVEGGEVIKVIVGEFGNVGNEDTQGDVGFGGGRGGGLSGVFVGAPQLLETEVDRAWLVAGGGGAAGSTVCVHGVPGNHPDAGGQDTMRGENIDGAGGGGGYVGGSASASSGSRGGEGFVAAHAIDQKMEWSENEAQLPPAADDPDHLKGAGQQERNGHVVVRVYCSEDGLPTLPE